MTVYFDFIYGLSLGLQYINEYIDEDNDTNFVVILDLLCFRVCMMWKNVEA